MNNGKSIDFTDDQFKNQNKDIPWLCRTVKNEEYELGATSAPENTVEWLNEILQQTGFFDRVATEKRSLELTDEMKGLRDETAEKRKGSFKDLSQQDQQAIKRLNRLILEAAHPRETPKCGYQLTAMIRTRKGDSFLQEYRTGEDFKSDMKEHRNDIEWGLLVRGDQGKVIADYYSDMGDRDKIGPDQIEPHVTVAPEGLSPVEAALREAAIRNFKSNKRKRFILGHMNHINGVLQLGESIKFLFDQNGKPAVLPPLEEIIAEREKTEVKIKWLDAISSELHNSLASLKEVEEVVLEQLGRDVGNA